MRPDARLVVTNLLQCVAERRHGSRCRLHVGQCARPGVACAVRALRRSRAQTARPRPRHRRLDPAHRQRRAPLQPAQSRAVRPVHSPHPPRRRRRAASVARHLVTRDPRRRSPGDLPGRLCAPGLQLLSHRGVPLEDPGPRRAVRLLQRRHAPGRAVYGARLLRRAGPTTRSSGTPGAESGAACGSPTRRASRPGGRGCRCSCGASCTTDSRST